MRAPSRRHIVNTLFIGQILFTYLQQISQPISESHAEYSIRPLLNGLIDKCLVILIFALESIDLCQYCNHLVNFKENWKNPPSSGGGKTRQVFVTEWKLSDAWTRDSRPANPNHRRYYTAFMHSNAPRHLNPRQCRVLLWSVQKLYSLQKCTK